MQEREMGFSGRIEELKKTVVAGVIGFAVGALIMILYGYDPISAYTALFSGAFGDLYSFSESLANATPLILTALTFAIGFQGWDVQYRSGRATLFRSFGCGYCQPFSSPFWHGYCLEYHFRSSCGGNLESTGSHSKGCERRSRGHFNHNAELDISVSCLLSYCQNPG